MTERVVDENLWFRLCRISKEPLKLDNHCEAERETNKINRAIHAIL